MLLRDGKKLCYHIFSYFMKNKEALMDLCGFMDLEKGDVCRLAVLHEPDGRGREGLHPGL